GPHCEEGEPFNDFRDRFFRYYVEKIEAALTGDPRNVVASSNWARTFSAMFSGQVDRFRHPVGGPKPRPAATPKPVAKPIPTIKPRRGPNNAVGRLQARLSGQQKPIAKRVAKSRAPKR